MAARIRSLRNFITPIDEASRDDLAITDVVTVQSLDAATTYAWSLVFVPDGSAATFSGDPLAVSPGSFTVDLVGSYLVRLIVDATLGSEDTQYVRLRAVTTSLGLKLVAAGERRDESGIIPVDADPEGWANDQNANFQAIEAALGAVEFSETLSVPVTPNVTTTLLWFAPVGLTVVALYLWATTAPASAAGDYTFAATGAGNNLLSAATFDLETLVSGVRSSPGLTATTANLTLAAAAKVQFDFVSNNVDLTGANLFVQVVYTRS